MDLAVPDVILHQTLYLATLSHKESSVFICSMSLHHLIGHFQQHEFVHRPADDLHNHIAVSSAMKAPVRGKLIYSSSAEDNRGSLGCGQCASMCLPGST